MPRMRHYGVWIIGSIFIYAVSLAAYSFAFSFEYILAIEFLLGVSGQVWNVAVIAGMQLAVPEKMRGRVLGLIFMIA